MLRPANSGRLGGYKGASMARSTAGHRSILLTFPENCRRSEGSGLSNIAQQRTTTRSNGLPASQRDAVPEGAAGERALNARVRKQSRYV
jgi:hypothetical protein